MSEQNRRPESGRRMKYIVVIICLAVLLSVVCAVAIVMTLDGPDGENTNPTVTTTAPTEGTAEPSTEPSTNATEPSTEPAEPDPPAVPEVPAKLSTATVAATGDVLMHLPCITPARQSDGSYDFTGYFSHIQQYLEEADYAVANLETTLAGQGNGYKYSGYPRFNCPDEIVYDLQTVGLDLFLTANNHTYDTSAVGFDRTQQVIEEAGMDHIGTKSSEEVDDYLVKEIDGIQIGMVCYTYETDANADRVRLNAGAVLPSGVQSRINTFHEKDVEGFIRNLGQDIADMEADGAEAIVLYIHWGTEYQRRQNEVQEQFAQAACDLGVDVIVGGHPHVIQPMDLLTGTENPDHKTVVLYSTGNFISNQRKGNLSYVRTAHTEDGILFSFSFAKYSDGTVRLEQVELLPTWVNLRTDAAGTKVYDVLPLDTEIEDWMTRFGLTDGTLADAEASYRRTMEIVGDGLEEVQQYLSTLPEVE